jgi:hypothetical protein
VKDAASFIQKLPDRLYTLAVGSVKVILRQVSEGVRGPEIVPSENSTVSSINAPNR